MLGRFVPLPQLEVKKHGAPDAAAAAASAVMDKVFSGLSPLNVDFLRGLSIQLHIIPLGKQITDVAEFRRTSQTTPLGSAVRLGSRIVFAVREEDIAEGFIPAQESARVVARFALTRGDQQWLQRLFDERAQKGGTWISGEAAMNAEAYFSASAAVLFGYRFNRAWLHQVDPRMQRLVGAVFRHAPGPIPD
jgi:hypothetical protein